MNIKEILKNSEGRRLEFKSELPENADLAKTIVAFAMMLVENYILGLVIILAKLLGC